MLVDDADESLAGVDQLPCMDILAANYAIARGDDVAVGEVQTGKRHLCACQLYGCLRRREVMTLLCHNRCLCRA